MTFTPEQAHAINIHHRNLIVTAGAGSGKTRVLVERFMALLDAHHDWALPSIVAITFTEKAAREMRDRVRSAIETRIRQAVEQGDAEALDRWLDHQAALNRARIGTIHALCAQLLRANPAEAELDPAFEVLDEKEAPILREDAMQGAMARLVHEGHPATELLVQYGVRTVAGVLRQHAGWGAAQAIAQAIPGSPEDVWHIWQGLWESTIRGLMAEAHANRKLWEALTWTPATGWPDDDKLMDNWRLIHRHLDALASDDPDAFMQGVAALALGMNRQGGKQVHWGGKEGLAECQEKLAVIKAWADNVPLLQRLNERDEKAAYYLLLWRDAITLAANEYTRLKEERHALDFDDLEARTRHLLCEHPEVAARYLDEFNHVLVDEFQDTNPAQRDIIYSLTGVREGRSGRLFVVGDPKQSIYAFRGADVSVFGDVRADLIACGGQEIPLAVSFRTHERLVNALNDLFGRILTVGSGPAARYEVERGQQMAAFRPSEPDMIQTHECPISLFLFRPPDEALYPGYQTADELRRWEAWTLAQHIHDLVRRGTPVWDRDLAHDDPAALYVPPFAAERGAYRPMGYGDVALLFQSMTKAPLYEDVFKAAGLPYVTVAGKGYFDRQEVRDLLNLLHALHNPADDLALAAVLRSPLFGLSDNALYALRLALDESGAPLPLWEALLDESSAAALFPDEEQEARRFACEVLRELRALAGRVSIADLLTRALHLTGYLATLTGLPDGARRRGNVEKLVKLARESGRVSLGAFTAYARDLTAREVREGEAAVEIEGAVTLMSVHASKGLEFPVVVLADTSWTHRSHDGVFLLDPAVGPTCKLPTDDPSGKQPQSFTWAWADTLAERRDHAERRRLLYVGATRAQDYLILSGSLLRLSKQSWLHQVLDALGLAKDDLRPSPEPWFESYDWGHCMVCVPDTPPPPGDLTPRVGAASPGWDHPAVQARQPLPAYKPALPPLLAPLDSDPSAPARALTATHIAKLGRAPYTDPSAWGRALFRHSVLHDMPEPIRPLPDRRVDDRALRLSIGVMVHRALRAWLLPGQTPEASLRARLETYAWEQHLSDPAQVEFAVAQALDLLRRFERSETARDIGRASQVYRELSFVYRTERRTIHGVIDVLYFDGRQWHVLDYKTAPVGFKQVEDNARAYFLQVGVYAAAVAARVGQTPQTYLYYVHPARLYHVRPAQWEPALAQLEDDLRAALDV